ncbi:MAG: response regulator [Candidatus Zixiibacteriota bacterium]
MGQKTVLIIDDELLIRDLLYDFFSEKGWGVSIYNQGEKALEILKNKKYDIALIDLKSTETDSTDYVRKLKNLYPQMPIVVMTAFPSVETAVAALRLKLDDYIIKPFNINQLYKTLDGLAEQAARQEKYTESDKIHNIP